MKEVAISPYIIQRFDGGDPLHFFSFHVIKLWEVPTEQLKNLGLKGLLPLLTLTAEGKSQAVVEEMIKGLCEGEKKGQSDLLSLAYMLSSLRFRSSNEQQWLKWRFNMLTLDDMLEESWVLQEILQKGVKQGVEQGLEQGLQQGVEQGLQQGVEQGRQEALLLSRHTILAIVEHRAPALLPLARTKVDYISDFATLQNLILQISFASNESEIRIHLE